MDSIVSGDSGKLRVLPYSHIPTAEGEQVMTPEKSEKVPRECSTRRENEHALVFDASTVDATLGVRESSENCVCLKIEIEGSLKSCIVRPSFSSNLLSSRLVLASKIQNGNSFKLRETHNWGFLYCPSDKKLSREDENLTICQRVHSGKFSVDENMLPRFLPEHKPLSTLGLNGETIELAFCPRFRIRAKPMMMSSGGNNGGLSAFSLTRASIFTLQSVFNSPSSSSPVSPFSPASINSSLKDTKKNLTYSKIKKLQHKFFDLVTSKKIEKVAKSLDEGYDPNFVLANGTKTPLIAAIEAEDVQMMAVLIERGGAFADFRSPDTRTPLHWAAHQNKCQAIRYLLLDCDAYVDARDESGATPLFSACSAGNEEAVRMLLMARADPNAKDTLSRTPLYLACYEGHLACARLLLDYGASPDIVNNSGNTPLHAAACATNSNECAILLLRRGANRSKLNFSAQTASQVALLAGKFDLAGLISRFRDADVEATMPPTPDMFGIQPDPYFDSFSPSRANCDTKNDGRRKSFTSNFATSAGGSNNSGGGIFASITNFRRRANTGTSGPKSKSKSPPRKDTNSPDSVPISSPKNNAHHTLPRLELSEAVKSMASVAAAAAALRASSSMTQESENSEEAIPASGAWHYSKVPVSLLRKKSANAALLARNAALQLSEELKQEDSASNEERQEHLANEIRIPEVDCSATALKFFSGKRKSPAPNPPESPLIIPEISSTGNSEKKIEVNTAEKSKKSENTENERTREPVLSISMPEIYKIDESDIISNKPIQSAWEEAGSNETIVAHEQDIDKLVTAEAVALLTTEQHNIFRLLVEKSHKIIEENKRLRDLLAKSECRALTQ